MAAHKVFPGYNDMADAKALLESIARNFGYYYGKSKKVRVNTVSQSPTATNAATSIVGFSELSELSDGSSPLGNATAQDLAEFICMLFSDYTRKVTMQNLYHDGGFSSMGIK
jgi:enoyl-[acyl-carrier protein] reductase I